MKISFVRLCVAILLAGIALPVLHAEEKEKPPFDVDKMLSLGEKKAFPWSVYVTATQASEERFLIQVDVKVEGGAALSAAGRRDMHFVVKVAKSDSQWVPGMSYGQVLIPAKFIFQMPLRISYTDEIYVRPGEYTVAIIAYDPLQRKVNVARKTIKTPRLQKGFPPEPNASFNDVEFVESEDSDIPPLDSFDNPPSAPSNLFASGKTPKWMHVENKRPICVDIVANAAIEYQLLGLGRRAMVNPLPADPVVDAAKGSHTTTGLIDYGRFSGTPQRKFPKSYSIIPVMQATSVLSRLKLREGNVRVTIFDAFRMKTLYDRVNAADFDLKKARELIEKQNLDDIDVDDLKDDDRNAAFIHDTLETIANDSCSSDAQPPLKIIIIISDQMRFPMKLVFPQLTLPSPSATKLFYICYDDYESDDIYKIIKEAKPKLYESIWVAGIYPYLFSKKPSKEQLDLRDFIAYLESQGC